MFVNLISFVPADQRADGMLRNATEQDSRGTRRHSQGLAEETRRACRASTQFDCSLRKNRHRRDNSLTPLSSLSSLFLKSQDSSIYRTSIHLSGRTSDLRYSAGFDFCETEKTQMCDSIF